ncbi:ABC transporter ATP-binding protein [Candidatus Poribacteria bacterium]|nr:ABC transporter ATP-binding protein [Candidatus Poribacteria bacterium]
MSIEQGSINHHIIGKYTDQPEVLPSEIRGRLQDTWGGAPVQLYALADLDGSLKLAERWVALGPEHLAIAERHPEGEPAVHTFERVRIKAVRESPGLSCTTLSVLGDPGEPALAVLRYTHRQRRAMDNIKFVLEQAIEGHGVEVPEQPDEVYAEAVAQPIGEAQAAFASNKLAVIWRLLLYMKPYKVRVAWGMGAAALMTLCGLVPPFIIGSLIDGVFRPFQSGELARAAALNKAWWLVAAVAMTYLAQEFFAWARLRTMSVMGELVARDLRDDLYEHLQKLSLSYFSRKQTGSIISRVSSDTDRLWDFVAFGVVEVSLSVIKLIGLGVVLVTLDWPLGLVMIMPVPVLLYAIFRHGQRMQQLFLRAWRKWSNLTDVLSDTIPGIRVVKAFNREKEETGRFKGRNFICVEEFNGIHSIWTGFWPRLMLSVHATVIVAWLLAIPRLLAAENPTLTVGTFVSFLLYMTMFFQPIEIIGQMARMLNRATSSAHRVFEVLDTEPAITDREGCVKLGPVEGRVTFENVVFAYDGVRQILKGISFEVKPGEMIGLVGPSGAGKTTITNLIVRFYEVSGGRILIDGLDLKALDTGHFRRQVGMVLQDPYLFHGTVLDNIRYGMPEATIEEVIEASKAANAHDFICKLPHAYDTVVGERGHTLSGGERQRVSIARAVLCNPRILILDEATSSVDTETERKIQEALDRLVAGRTVFAIAHRLSTLTRANRLFVIEDGRLTEEGTHAELLAKENGTYRKLHELQRELHELYAV